MSPPHRAGAKPSLATILHPRE
eukprot:SAG11_NODE_34122_length_273_cov_1.793103_1_plen_21_part_01